MLTDWRMCIVKQVVNIKYLFSPGPRKNLRNSYLLVRSWKVFLFFFLILMKNLSEILFHFLLATYSPCLFWKWSSRGLQSANGVLVLEISIWKKYPHGIWMNKVRKVMKYPGKETERSINIHYTAWCYMKTSLLHSNKLQLMQTKTLSKQSCMKKMITWYWSVWEHIFWFQ